LGAKASQGTGWLVDRDRKLLVTNRHVVGTQKQVQVLFPVYRNGQLIDDRAYYLKEAPRYRGQVIEANASHDLAIVQLDHLPKEVRPLKLAAERRQSHQSLLLLGNPLDSPTMRVQTLGPLQSAAPDRFQIQLTAQGAE